MAVKSIQTTASSSLPSFLLPCPRCGYRMKISAVALLRDQGGDLKGVTHSCAYCGTTLKCTIGPFDQSQPH
jgi:hypothetical protein